MAILSRSLFAQALQTIEAADFTSYIFQYPPLAVWPLSDKNQWVRESWEKTAAQKNELGLYIHIPFCSTKCTFCRFFVIESQRDEDHAYFVQSLASELALWSPLFASRQFSTLYFGGGTPSLLSLPHLKTVFRSIHGAFRFTPEAQVCFEANPEFLDKAKISFLREMSVDRLTLGVQSLDDEVTECVDRTQTNSRVQVVYEMARQVGIPHINIDLMLGLPRQTSKSFQATLREVVQWRPDMIHVNPFLPTPFTRFSQQGDSLAPKASTQHKNMSVWASQYLSRRGYSSIAYDAMGLNPEARNYQLEASVVHSMPFLGLGPGAVSCAPGMARHVNTASLKTYRQLLEQGQLPIFKACPLSPRDEQINYALNNLWYGSISEGRFENLFGLRLNKTFQKSLIHLKELGLLIKYGDQWLLRDRSSSSQFEVRRAFFEDDVVRAVLEKRTLKRRWDVHYATTTY